MTPGSVAVSISTHSVAACQPTEVSSNSAHRTGIGIGRIAVIVIIVLAIMFLRRH
jgi:hypothetical protein